MRKSKEFDVTRIKADAERELGAFLAAVPQVLGDAEVERAADLWLSTLENLDWNGGDPGRLFRRITIDTVSRLAREVTGVSIINRKVLRTTGEDNEFRDVGIQPGQRFGR